MIIQEFSLFPQLPGIEYTIDSSVLTGAGGVIPRPVPAGA
jgi:hypothetical protein